MKEVHVKGQTLQFPDEMSDSQIDAVVKRDFFSDQTSGQKAQANLNRIDAGKDLPPNYDANSLNDPTIANFARETPLGQIMLGAGKGAMNTSRHVGMLVTGAATGDFGPLEDQSIAQDIRPTNPMEKTGYGAEQVGEYFIPAAAGLKAAKGAGALTRSGVEAASAATVAGAQGGNPVAAGLTAGTVPLASSAVKTLAPMAADAFLGTKARNISTGAKPGESVLQEGVWGLTGGKYLEGIKKAQASVMARLNSFLGNVSNVTIDAEPTLKPLDSAIATAGPFPNQKQILQDLKNQIVAEAQQNGWQLNKLTPMQMNQMRMRMAEFTDAALGDQSVPEAVKNALFKVKILQNNAIDAVAPGAKHLNQTYGSLSEASSAYRAKLNSGTGKFWDLVAQTVAAPAVMGDFKRGDYSGMTRDMIAAFIMGRIAKSPAVAGNIPRAMNAVGNPTFSSVAAKAAGFGASEATQDDNQ